MQGSAIVCFVLLNGLFFKVPFGFVPAVFFIAGLGVLLAGRCALGGQAHLSRCPRALLDDPSSNNNKNTCINTSLASWSGSRGGRRLTKWRPCVATVAAAAAPLRRGHCGVLFPTRRVNHITWSEGLGAVTHVATPWLLVAISRGLGPLVSVV